jgi:hypothetical protein
MEHSPNVELNYLFVDTNHRVFEHVVGIPFQVQSLSLIDYTKVCIYGSASRLIHDIVDGIRKKGYHDYEEVKHSHTVYPNKQSTVLEWNPTRLEMLLQAGMDFDDT